MTTDAINLKDFYPELKNDVRLEQYVMTYSGEFGKDKKYPAMIICPGGAYAFTSDREAEPIALAFLAHGINCFVLRYSVAPERYPTAHTELAAAFAFVRARAEEYRIRPDAIGVLGFSAGGHLVGSYAAGLWHEGGFAEALGLDAEELRPNAMVLCYGVLTTGEFTHSGSIANLLGENDTPEMREKLSTERLVGKYTPPAFIWHTCTDQAVPVENSLMVAGAMSAVKIPFEMHIYPECGHGIARANRLTTSDDNHLPPAYIARWTEDCAAWLLRVTNFVK